MQTPLSLGKEHRQAKTYLCPAVLAQAIDDGQLAGSVQRAGIVVQQRAASLQPPVAHADDRHPDRQGLQVQLEGALLAALSCCRQRTIPATGIDPMTHCNNRVH